MGSYWLHEAKDPLVAALGSKLKFYKGWETRSRSTGGFDGIYGIVMHHDADSNTSGGSEDNVLDYEWNSTGGDQPIGNFHVQRDGDVWFGCAGASNHAGKGGSVQTSKGTVPLDAGNKFLIGIEASNNGTGETWGTAIMESYLTLVTTLCQIYNFDPETDIYGHWTWVEPSCPGRKIDPWGPATGYSQFGTQKWNMEAVQDVIKSRLSDKPPPKPEPEPEPEMPDFPKAQGVGMWLIMKYGGTPTSNWSGYYSDGNKRYGINSASGGMDHVARLVRSGAKDAKTNATVTDLQWDGVSHTTSQSELTKYLGPA